MTALPARTFPTEMQPQTVLVVDDNEACREAMSGALTYAGFRVFCASDGREGVEAARRLRPDMIFMDLMMPEMDGWAAIAALRSDPGTAAFPVIACTASTPDLHRVRDAGFSACIAKPTRLPALIDAIRAHSPANG